MWTDYYLFFYSRADGLAMGGWLIGRKEGGWMWWTLLFRPPYSSLLIPYKILKVMWLSIGLLPPKGST